MGCADRNDGPQRFGVCSADAAAEYLRKFKVNEADIHEFWTAIVLHTSPGIAERSTALARFVRLAVLVDFDKLAEWPWVDKSELGIDEKGYRRGVEEHFSRLDVEKVLGDIVVEQGMKQPTKAPASIWAGNMVRAIKEEASGLQDVNKAF